MMRPIHIFSVFSLLCLASCAGKTQYSDVYDPYENYNRKVFAVNETLDQYIAKPVAQTYRVILPEPAREGTRNVLRNLSTPVNAGNQILQGDVGGFMTDLGRALVNTTIGIGGIFDVAGALGLDHEPEDFGQTLAVWGFSDGPYFIIPVLGPSNLRDGTGRMVDAFADPLSHYLVNTEQEEWLYARNGVTIVSQREGLIEVLEDLEAGSIDYYAVMRSSYKQYRDELIHEGGGHKYKYADIPDYDDLEDEDF